MVIVVDILGHDINFDVKELLLVADHSLDGAKITCLHGFSRGVIQTFDEVTDLLSKLGVESSFGRLTRADGTSIWVHAPSVAAVQAMAVPDQAASCDNSINICMSVLSVGSLKQAVREKSAEAISVLNAHGAVL